VIRPAPDAEAMPRSGIREVMDLAWSLPGPIIGLHVGEPSSPTPAHVLDGARAALAPTRHPLRAQPRRSGAALGYR
jgi:aspartate aminotransferase